MQIPAQECMLIIVNKAVDQSQLSVPKTVDFVGVIHSMHFMHAACLKLRLKR